MSQCTQCVRIIRKLDRLTESFGRVLDSCSRQRLTKRKVQAWFSQTLKIREAVHKHSIRK